MRIAVDAHAIGRHLTGNEVYVRSLLNALAAKNHGCEFVAYVSSGDADRFIPANISTRRVAANPYVRLGYDLAMKVRQDQPDLLHVQYTAPVGCATPIVVSVHGCKGHSAIHVGGLDQILVGALTAAFVSAQYPATSEGHPYPAIHPRNICNRSRRGCGVQLEFTAEFRGAQHRPGVAQIVRQTIAEEGTQIRALCA